MNNTWSWHAHGMIRLNPTTNTNVFYISLFIKHVYRALLPLLEYPWPYFKRQLTVFHSFWYHGHLGRPHTGRAPAPLCGCTNSRTQLHRNWYCGIKKQNSLQLFVFPFISDNDNVYFTWTPTSFLRRRISPALLSAIATAHNANAFVFMVCAHTQFYRARSVALLPGHK